MTTVWTRWNPINVLPKGGLSRRLVVTVASLAIFVFIWWVGSRSLNTVYLPAPEVVFAAFISSFTTPDPSLQVTMWQNISASLQRFLLGFALAFAIAVPLGLIMGFSRIVETFSTPIVEVFRPIPPIAWITFLFLATGTFLSPIITVFIGVFFPILSNVQFGVRSVEQPLIDAAKTQGAGRLVLFRKVILPYSVPFLMTGVRIGMGIGWMCIVAAELIAPIGGGVGFYINYMSQIGRFDSMFAGMIVIAILGIGTTGLAGYAEKLTSRRMGMK
jgi:ABC-type nitrate/sulfonate/bicarbonate transport system permease component